MSTSRIPEPQLTEAAQALSRIAEELSRVSSRLAARAEEGSDEAELLGESQKVLTSLSQELGEWDAPKKGTTAHTARTAQLRHRILQDLLRRGPALPIELAAATLSLPEEIQPILQDLTQEDLIEIREVKGGRLVTLTARGRREAGR
jgi:hypothetical protein